MKMHFNYLAVLAFTASIACFQAQAAAPVSQARAAELSLHRIEKLVILKKIQATHLTRLQTLTLTILPHSTDDEAAYQITAAQFPGADGSRFSVQIPLKSDGKALNQTETLGTEPVSAPEWTGQDAISLAENALHCVQGEILDNDRPELCAGPEFASFESGFTSLLISQERDSTGVIAVIDIHAQGTPKTLRIRLKADGVPTADSPISFLP